MENATLTPRRQGPEVQPPTAGPLRARLSWPAAAFAVLCGITVWIFVAYPTYPNYDSVYSLIWGRELLNGTTPSFEAYRAPTEHPLAIAFGAALALLGEPADRVMLAFTLLSFLGLVAGLYRLGRTAFSPVIGAVAAAILCTRLDFPFLALRGYIDVTYLAFVVWAAALEYERPRTGYRVPLLLAGAALMRPEAWLLAGLYFLWAAWPHRRALVCGRVLKLLALGVLGPVLWVATDFTVTGEPLFSLTHTSSLADELGRDRPPSEIPQLTLSYLRQLASPTVFAIGVGGLIAAVLAAPRRIAAPMALLVIGVGTFFMIGVAGLSVIDRYLLVASVVIMLFAAVAIAGASLLNPGRVRTAAVVAGVLLAALAGYKTNWHVNRTDPFSELNFRGAVHAKLVDILENPKVVAGLKCGPLSTPSHKLIPEVRWIADLPEDKVLARTDPEHSAVDKGVPGITSDKATATGLALLVTTRATLLRQAVVEDNDTPLDNIPPDGMRRLAFNGTYAVYTSC
ncbi:hypothetical protein DSM112329_02221 [Paraconexibacter sp. AEG42_29]|uniref:Glycosyltransferase RgtA/B/C/D-like domain-containing protein n=1 Tax=Paraconexibacter sp. AEG42_29 TaxID=2997339 RepID=A0AAU7AUI9_9ACTN